MDNCGRSILIVDDDPDFRELVSVLCGRSGYSCVEAESRADALAAASLKRPDVVLLDVMLAGTSGYQICRELREEFGERLPIICDSEQLGHGRLRTPHADRQRALRRQPPVG